MFNKLKISKKIIIGVIVSFILIYFIGAIVIYKNYEDNILKLANENFLLLSKDNSKLITNELNKALNITNSLSNIISLYNLNEQQSRTDIIKIIEKIFDENKNYNAVWIVAEPQNNDN